MIAASTLALRRQCNRQKYFAAVMAFSYCCAGASFEVDSPANLCLLQLSATALDGSAQPQEETIKAVGSNSIMLADLREEFVGILKRSQQKASHQLHGHRQKSKLLASSDSTSSMLAVGIGAGIGALVAALTPDFTSSWLGGTAFVGGIFRALVGGLVGGMTGWIISSESGSDIETHEMAEPYTEKLHELALTLLAITANLQDSNESYNETIKAEISNDMKEALKVLKNIELEIDQGVNATPEDLHIIEEIFTHQKYAVFLSAEAAEANREVLTAHDVALIEAEDDLSKLFQGEDVGPAGNLDSLEGDMIPEGNESDNEQVGLSRKISDSSVLDGTSRAAGPLWDNGQVFYCFAPDVPVSIQHIFEAAVKEISNAVPCITFLNVGHRSGNSYDSGNKQQCGASPAIFVQSNPREGCYSYVGMIKQWKSQKLQLQYPGCNVLGIAVHEVQHALGVAHEQSRPDRGRHVRINWPNIQSGMEPNFMISQNAHVAIPYDFLSNMHYDAFAFARNRQQPTIIEIAHPEHTVNEVGQRVGLAASDVKQLSQMYSGVSSQSCDFNKMTGLGCIDKPASTGKSYCSGISSCTAEAVEKCCACGGGVKVQCYENMECPQADPLPPAAGSCIVSKSSLFPPGTGCVYTNICSYNVKWKCPGLSCTHATGPGGYWQTSCGGTQQTQICNFGTCDVWKAR